MKYLDGSNFTAQTLDGQGKPLANQNVSFNVNGVFYHKVTNKDSIASLGIRLMSGEYITSFLLEWLPNWKHNKNQFLKRIHNSLTFFFFFFHMNLKKSSIFLCLNSLIVELFLIN